MLHQFGPKCIGKDYPLLAKIFICVDNKLRPFINFDFQKVRTQNILRHGNTKKNLLVNATEFIKRSQKCVSVYQILSLQLGI